MYRSDLNNRDKSGAIAAVVAIHAALLFALLHLSGKIELRRSAKRAAACSTSTPRAAAATSASAAEAGNPSPRKRKAARRPRTSRAKRRRWSRPSRKIETPPVQPIPATETPRQGSAPTQGASDVRGPGTGAGGAGNGTGSGVGRQRPGRRRRWRSCRSAAPRHSGADAAAISRATCSSNGRAERPVFLRLRVDPHGYVSECTSIAGPASRRSISTMCNIAHDRLRFRPAVNRSGQAVAGWFGYAQPAPR